MPAPKSAGSGYFSVVAGVLFAIALFLTFVPGIDAFDPLTLFRAWLAFAAVILVGWGIQRVVTGDRADLRVGQPTLSFVVTVIGATLAFWALVIELLK